MPQLYLNADYTEKQKKLIKAVFPKEYAELYPEEVKEPEPEPEPETKKEEEPAAE
tara:strand:- start:840 stop:1004 length:165 start_codon:yes stop_codon:yes gene_type:complete